MRTYQITEAELKQYKKVGEGYKAFRNDWTARCGQYDYKDENGEVLNTIHKVDGKIARCEWGLHFSELPDNCFNFYESVQWNKFAKVEAYDQILVGEEKSVTNILKIVKIYSFDEFIKLFEETPLFHVNGGSYINGGNEINGGDYIDGGNHINGGIHITGGSYINGGNNISGGSHIKGGNYINGGICIDGGSSIDGGSYINGGNEINGGDYIDGGNHINGGNHISGGNYINGGNNISGGNHINGGSNISGGNHIKGGNHINGGNHISGGYDIKGGSYIWGATKCEGVSRCIFCYGVTGRLLLFNKPISEVRFIDILTELEKFGWYPKFNNALELKGNLEWYETNIPAIAPVNLKTAWSSMPKDMEEYIKSLPEYDEEIFNKVTGR